MEVLHILQRLFEDHAPETLMAFFGAATSLVLFSLVWALLRHLFGLQDRSGALDADQDQATSALVDALVNALVVEAGHLRHTLDNILKESLRRNEHNAQLLTQLLRQNEDTPNRVLELLKPEFDSLHQQLHQAGDRLVMQGMHRPEMPVETSTSPSADRRGSTSD